MLCSNCGKEIDDNSTYCLDCGKQIVSQQKISENKENPQISSTFFYCGKCGVKMSRSSGFCPKCGVSTNLEKEIQSEVSAVTKRSQTFKIVMIVCLVLIAGIGGTLLWTSQWSANQDISIEETTAISTNLESTFIEEDENEVSPSATAETIEAAEETESIESEPDIVDFDDLFINFLGNQKIFSGEVLEHHIINGQYENGEGIKQSSYIFPADTIISAQIDDYDADGVRELLVIAFERTVGQYGGEDIQIPVAYMYGVNQGNEVILLDQCELISTKLGLLGYLEFEATDIFTKRVNEKIEIYCDAQAGTGIFFGTGVIWSFESYTFQDGMFHSIARFSESGSHFEADQLTIIRDELHKTNLELTGFDSLEDYTPYLENRLISHDKNTQVLLSITGSFTSDFYDLFYGDSQKEYDRFTAAKPEDREPILITIEDFSDLKSLR